LGGIRLKHLLGRVDFVSDRVDKSEQRLARFEGFVRHCHADSGLRSRWRFCSQGMKKISYRGYRFPPVIIQQAICPGSH
jgi:hypothetical protein